MYLIENQVNKDCLTLRPGDTAAQIPTLSPILTERDGETGSALQHWRFITVPGVDAFYWGIVPRDYLDYALGLYNNHLADDQWVIPAPLWGGPPTLFHAWSTVPAAPAGRSVTGDGGDDARLADEGT